MRSSLLKNCLRDGSSSSVATSLKEKSTMSTSQRRMLTIDLSKRLSASEEIPDAIIRQYVGGRGLGSYLLYRLVPAKADPLGPDNHLIFTAGALSGTGFFYSSKANLKTKSPQTGIYLYSICSGILAQEMRKAGYWALDIKGIAESPTYLVINDDRVEFRDASSLWGMETAAAQKLMLGELPATKAATVGTGRAGEQLIKYAALFGGGDLYRCFGRGGAGAVMGSKKLKGLVVTGSGKVTVLNKDRFRTAKGEITQRLKMDFKTWGEWWRRHETTADLATTNELGIIPT